jgi:hypothetical protein
LFLVGLKLLVGFPDICVFIGWILELNNLKRETVQEKNDIWTTRVGVALDGELVDREPVVLFG